jgi:hypothetical protein
VSRRQQSPAELQAACDAFNQTVQVGAKVALKRDGSDRLWPTKTRSNAQVMGGHSAVIWLDGISGSYLLDRVTPIDDAEFERLWQAELDDDNKGRERRRKNFAVRVEPTRDPDFEGEQTLSFTYNGRQEYPMALAPHEAQQVVDALRAAFNIK